MGGPWRDRGYELTGRKPAPPRGGRAGAVVPVQRDWTWRIVLAYLACVLTSFAIALTLFVRGW